MSILIQLDILLIYFILGIFDLKRSSSAITITTTITITIITITITITIIITAKTMNICSSNIYQVEVTKLLITTMRIFVQFQVKYVDTNCYCYS
ncbi:unnamed protein product [Rotaria sp. Silwood2]|nr:unnamed protein product [Rotaria sp. Silwood2]CAF4524754.1 unnamed protein product [Rotaria sp. Silwood2]